LGRRLFPTVRPPFLLVPRRLFARPLGRRPFRGRRQLDASTPRLRQSDGDRLLRRPRAMSPFADVIELLLDELAGLCRRRLSFPFILASPLDRLALLLIRHPLSP